MMVRRLNCVQHRDRNRNRRMARRIALCRRNRRSDETDWRTVTNYIPCLGAKLMFTVVGIIPNTLNSVWIEPERELTSKIHSMPVSTPSGNIIRGGANHRLQDNVDECTCICETFHRQRLRAARELRSPSRRANRKLAPPVFFFWIPRVCRN